MKRENTNSKISFIIKHIYSPDPPLRILFSPPDPPLKKKQTEACLTEEIDDEETLVQPVYTICSKAVVT